MGVHLQTVGCLTCTRCARTPKKQRAGTLFLKGLKMIRGFAEKNLATMSWDIALVNEEGNKAYTFTISEHTLDESAAVPVSKFSLRRNGHENLLYGFLEALRQMGLVDQSATQAELRMVKAHLSDMRMIAFHELSNAKVDLKL